MVGLRDKLPLNLLKIKGAEDVGLIKRQYDIEAATCERIIGRT